MKKSDDVLGLLEFGKKRLDAGDYDNALDFFEQALLIDPTNPDLWNFKGITLRSLGRYDEASVSYTHLTLPTNREV